MTFERFDRWRAVTVLATVGVVAVCAFVVVKVVPVSSPLPFLIGGPSVASGTARLESLDGWVRRHDAETGVVHVARGVFHFFAPSAVTIGPDAVILIHDRVGVVADLHRGLDVSVCYELRGGTRWARAIEAPPTAVPCRLVGSDAAPPRSDGAAPTVPPPVAPAVQPPGSSSLPDARSKRTRFEPKAVAPPMRSVRREPAMPPPMVPSTGVEAQSGPPVPTATVPPIRIGPASPVRVPEISPQAASVLRPTPAMPSRREDRMRPATGSASPSEAP
jgi:hypothetical protein